jgi:hypothetical protein
MTNSSYPSVPPRPKPGILGIKRTESKIKHHYDSEVEEKLKELISKFKHDLAAEHETYCLYKDEDGKIYALIHSFYMEENGVVYEEMDELAKAEGKFLHEEVKKLGLKLDYLWIMPYYDYVDREKGSCLTEIVVTKDFD